MDSAAAEASNPGGRRVIRLGTSLKKILGATLLFVFAIALLAGCGSDNTQGGTAKSSSGPKVAPDFTVRTLIGSTISFSSDLKGKPLVIKLRSFVVWTL